MDFGGGRSTQGTRVVLFSERYQFLFVHIPKTAGTAIRRALEPYSTLNSRSGLAKQLSRLPVRQSAEAVSFRLHVTARWARRKLPREQFEAWCKFAVVRNPFDRAVSHYHWQSQDRGQRYFARTQGMSFKHFLDDMRRRQVWHDHSQARYICDEAGVMLIDRMLRFEALTLQFNALMSEIGVAATLAVHNASRHDPYEAYYDEEARQMVVDLFARDFELLGYSHDVQVRQAVRRVADVEAPDPAAPLQPAWPRRATG